MFVICSKPRFSGDDEHGDDDGFGPLAFWMMTISFACCFLVTMATMGVFRCRKCLTYWDQEGSLVVKAYLQKMSVYNSLLLAALYIVYKYVFNEEGSDTDTTECLKLGEHTFIVFMILTGSLVAGLIRFLAVGFANSENYDWGGRPFANHQGNSVHGFSMQTSNIYKNMIGPYLKLMCGVLLLASLFLYAPIPTDFTDPVLDTDFCLTSWPITAQGYNMWRLLPIVLLLLLPIFTIVLVEHVTHIWKNGFFTKTPGYISILNAPFIMVGLTTTWTMWFVIMLVTWWTFGIGAGEYFSMLTLVFLCCDCVVLLSVAIIVGRRNQRLC
jgi:hypothetical protein